MAISIQDWLAANQAPDFGPKDQDRMMYYRKQDDWLTRHYQDLYNGVANGSISVAPDQFNALVYDLPANTTDPYSGINVNEFATLSPEVQAWARANPQAFVQDVIAHRNPDTQDMLSISDDGGYVPSSMGNVKITNGKMDWGNAQYIPVDDNGFFGSLMPLLAIGGLAFGLPTLFGAEGLLGGAALETGAAAAGEGLLGGAALDAGVTAGANSVLGATTLGDIALANAANAGIDGFGLDMIGSTAAGSGIANAGYIDTLGGLTDATGTAMSGWSGPGSVLSSAASLPDDLVSFLDSPAGGGGTTTDWWKQALSPSSNYTLSDLANVATPSSVSNLLNNVSPSTAKLIGTALGAIAGGSGGGGNSAPADNIGTGNNIYNPAGFSYTQPTYQPYTGGLLFGRRV